MVTTKSYIPIKIVVSYGVLFLLFGSVGWFLYSENKSFTKNELGLTEENSSLLKIGTILSDLYKSESLARIAIQSEQAKDYDNYVEKTKVLTVDIDSLKEIVSTSYQRTLLDSVQLLLANKTVNIKQLKLIKSKTEDENAVSDAITDLTKMESLMRHLQMEDFVKYPARMGEYERNILKKYVAYLNANIPEDSSNTLSKKESDSIVSASKILLNEVRHETSKKKKLLGLEESKLLQNELSISEQLRTVFAIIEREIVKNTTANYLERENSLKKTNQIITLAAITGLLLTLFFLILILNDFSKTQSYKKQLEAANFKTKKLLSSREQLIATVSHDLKTPLNTIMGYTELLVNSDLTTKQLYFTKNIKGSSDYISKLVQDLLDFTQIEAGKIIIEKIPFSLPEIINEVAKNIQSVHATKSIKLSIKIDEKLEQKIIGDPYRLRQILSNIIGNAFKFTEKGFIKIETKIVDDAKNIYILIEDSGIGIEIKNQQIIFDEFTQADEKIEKKYGGTGLGLTISKKIISILGGKLSLKSQIGKGSAFEIVLPLLLDIETIADEKNNFLLSKKAYTIIIIDDDLSLLALTSEVLRLHGYLVKSFSEAAGALLWMETNLFDFIITDIQMPIMDGFLFLKEMKKKHDTGYLNQPVIAVTGRNDLEMDYYKKLGFTTVIHKPYSPKTLVSTLNAIINKTEIPQHTKFENEANDSKKPYSLKELKLFLADDKGAIKEVLVSFMMDNEKNLTLLEQAITDSNYKEIKEIAHKMNPMFKQIKAFEISRDLDRLELEDLTMPTIKTIVAKLKNTISALFVIFEKKLN